MIKYLDEKIEKYAELRNISIEQAVKEIQKFEKQRQEREEKIKYTGSEKYLEWLYNYIQPNKIYDDETALYELEEGKDRENVLKFSYLQRYIERKAEELDVENILDKDNEFQILNYIFSYKDKMYQIDTMVGQGAITFMSLTDNKENRKIVKL